MEAPDSQPFFHAHCSRCGASFQVRPLSESDRGAVVHLVRSSGPLAAARDLHSRLGAPLDDAKGLAFHLTTVRGTCHRCGQSLPSTGLVTCPICPSLNLDW